MLAVITLLVLAMSSLIVTRIATVALTLTGLSRESARFQARSALTGAGFTTAESEAIVNHPVRRRIVMTLMFAGSIGLVSGMATLSTTFITSQDTGDASLRVATLVAGMAVILWLATSKAFDRAMQPVIKRALRRFTELDVQDYAALLHVAGDYSVMELAVAPGDWVADRSLKDLRLPDEGVLVLGIIRDGGTYVGAPEGDTVIQPGETLVLYGRAPRLQELDQRDRITGDRMHVEAEKEQDHVEATQDPMRKRFAQKARAGAAQVGDRTVNRKRRKGPSGDD